MNNIRYKALLFLTLISAFAGLSLSASEASSVEDIRVSASAIPSSCQVGQPIQYELRAEYPKDVKVEFPPVPKELSGLFVQKHQLSVPKSISRNRSSQVQSYELKAYAAGAFIIEPQTVVFLLPDGRTLEQKSERIYLDITSLLNEDDQDIRDIKKPFMPPKKWRWLLGALIGICGLLALILWIVKSIKHRKQDIAVPLFSPRDKALQALQELEQRNLLKRGQHKEYYFCVSSIMRSYLEDQFGFRAPEQTTEEFLSDLSQGEDLGKEHKNSLSAFLTECDLVKFANLDPYAEDSLKVFQSAKKFIHETSPVIEDPAHGH